MMAFYTPFALWVFYLFPITVTVKPLRLGYFSKQDNFWNISKGMLVYEELYEALLAYVEFSYCL